MGRALEAPMMIEVDQEHPWLAIEARTGKSVRGMVDVIVPDTAGKPSRLPVECQINRTGYRRTQPMDAETPPEPPSIFTFRAFPTNPDAIDEALLDDVTKALDDASPHLWKRAHDPDAADLMVVK
jgi:hypothetical protein